MLTLILVLAVTFTVAAYADCARCIDRTFTPLYLSAWISLATLTLVLFHWS